MKKELYIEIQKQQQQQQTTISPKDNGILSTPPSPAGKTMCFWATLVGFWPWKSINQHLQETRRGAVSVFKFLGGPAEEVGKNLERGKKLSLSQCNGVHDRTLGLRKEFPPVPYGW